MTAPSDAPTVETIAPPLVFNHPLNEKLRIYLRLEYLFTRLHQLLRSHSADEHHFAIATLFEIMEVGARNELRNDLIKDLERQRNQMESYRNVSGVDTHALDQLIWEIDGCSNGLLTNANKLGQSLLTNEWLTSIRNRIHIPGGTCEFDLPAYYVWKKQDAQIRIQDLEAWLEPLADYRASIFLLLRLMRETAVQNQVVAQNGSYQQMLPAEKGYQLAMVTLSSDQGIYPVVSGTRLMFSVRMQKLDVHVNRSDVVARSDALAVDQDIPFMLALCA